MKRPESLGFNARSDEYIDSTTKGVGLTSHPFIYGFKLSELIMQVSTTRRLMALGLIALALMSSGCFHDEPRALSAETDIESICDLRLDTCQWVEPRSTNEWEIQIAPASERFQRLLATVLIPGSSSGGRVVMVWEGYSMELGRYPIPLSHGSIEQDSPLKIEFRIPFCSTDEDMRWQLSMEVNGKKIPMPHTLVW